MDKINTFSNFIFHALTSSRGISKFVRGIPIRILLPSASLTKFYSEKLSNNKDNVQDRILLPSAYMTKFYLEKLCNNKENVQNIEIESPYYTF